MNYSKKTDQKWQKIWKDTEIYKYQKDDEKEKLYVMEMFSYPSGANLHLGHWFNFGPSDSFARFKKMQGYNVFHPMGFDAFGLPAENYALKTGIHPSDSTLKNIEIMMKQLEEMGGTFDWDYSVQTCNPDYYKWTQWLFLQLYKNGLAYKKKASVNWCGSCNTVLANEQVIDGHCERCETVIVKKQLEQWFFKATAYAGELLDELPDLDWPDITKKIQTNWIGRSFGAEITFPVADKDLQITVFTTRADTLNGVTYLVLAPESNIVDAITTESQAAKVESYRRLVQTASEIDRLSAKREKTGVFTGAYAVHPINGEAIPIWIADYVLEGYGTGCVMAVPAHDTRDFEFAQKYGLPINQVIENETNDAVMPYTEYGHLVNSGDFDGLSSEEAKDKIVSSLQDKGYGKKTINFRLKDWLVSRQRYWGAPIPIIYCESCGDVAVPESQLPILLPYDVEFRPDGESPLKRSEEFMNCTCPKCGGKALREADTLDTFVCSSWYFLRYPDAHNTEKPFDTELINKMLPVDVYVGGKEHAAMHLIYARFITKALRDLGYLNFGEPFKKLVHQGMILGSDGNKMSKSKGNTVSPNVFVDKYGSDVFRLYLMFGFSYIDGGPWKDEGIESISKYLKRISNLIDKFTTSGYKCKDTPDEAEKKLLFVQHSTVKAMEYDIGRFQFNTAVARSMEFLNELTKYESSEPVYYDTLFEAIKTLIILLAPLAPHFAEEAWETIGGPYSVHNVPWPKYDETLLRLNQIELPVQINGKVRSVVSIAADAPDEQVKEQVYSSDKISAILKDKKVKKEIYIKGKIYNIVL